MTAWEHRRTDPDGLTAREREVVALLCAGCTVKQISSFAGMRYETVRSHLKHVYKKLGVSSQVALVRRLRGPEAPAAVQAPIRCDNGAECPGHASASDRPCDYEPTVQAPPDATADTLPAPRTEAERKAIRDGVEDGSIVIDRQMRFVTRAQFMANPATALEQAAHGPVTVRGEDGDVRMVISAPSGADASTPLERALTAALELVAALEELRNG